MPNPADVRQILLAFFMITFFLSSMSLVWTYTVMVPFMRGSSYLRATCRLVGVTGIPKQCQNHTYFGSILVNSGVTLISLSFFSHEALFFRRAVQPIARILQPQSTSTTASSFMSSQLRLKPLSVYRSVRITKLGDSFYTLTKWTWGAWGRIRSFRLEV